MLDNLTSRALASYVRDPDGDRQPEFAKCGPADHAGLSYVVLRDAAGAVLAVYRVTRESQKGQLRRMRRPPKALLS
jgi:hypothetical protein